MRWHLNAAVTGRILTVLGAFLVFATFITKEVIRDRVRQLGNSIDQAKTLYAIAEQSDTIRSQLNRLEDSVNVLKARLWGEHPQPDIVFADLQDRAVIFVEGNKQRADMLDMIEGLVRTSAITNRWSDQIKDARNVQTQSHQLATHVIAQLVVAQGKWKEGNLDMSGLKKIQEEISGFDFESAFGMTKLWTLTDEVLKAVEGKRSREERLARIADWVSIGTYTLGWALALTGRLWGLDVGGVG